MTRRHKGQRGFETALTLMALRKNAVEAGTMEYAPTALTVSTFSE